MKRATEFGPWTMTAAHECRMNSFWNQRFDALQKGEAKRTSRRQWTGLFSVLVMLILMPSWQLGEQTAFGQATTIDQSGTAQSGTVQSTTAQRSIAPSSQPIDAATLGTATANSAPPSVGPIPPAGRRWQLIDSTQLPASNNVSLMSGQSITIDLPKGTVVATSNADGVFKAEVDKETGDIVIQGLKSGVGRLEFSPRNRDKIKLQVVVVADPAPLREKLANAGLAHITVTPGVQSVILTGSVPTPEKLKQCIALADAHYPHVVSNIQLRNDRHVMLECRVLEFTTSEDKLAETLDKIFSGGERIKLNGGAYTSLLDSEAIDVTLKELRKSAKVKMLAEPTLVTVSGRPASFNAGGEFPILVPQDHKTVAVEYKQFGTRIDFVPVVLKNGNIRLEMRPQVSSLMSGKDHSVTINGSVIPALKKRWIDVASEMAVNQTMAVALVQENDDNELVGFVTLVRPSLISTDGIPINASTKRADRADVEAAPAPTLR